MGVDGTPGRTELRIETDARRPPTDDWSHQPTTPNPTGPLGVTLNSDFG
jgi:hypothetical protein